MDNRPKTIICDIDGTLCEHSIPTINTSAPEIKILPGTIDKLSEWDAK
jgi:histidinol phosphatase-like enzyme